MGLERLGVWQAIAPEATIVTGLHTKDLATGETLVGMLPSRVAAGPAFGAVVSRTVLDDALRQAAMAAGATFEPGAAVREVELASRDKPLRVWADIDGRVQVFEADAVVAADGASSRISERMLGTKPGVLRGIAVRQYWTVPAPAAFTICIPIRDGVRDLAGYGWVFPMGENVANVGVGIMGGTTCSIRGVYRRFVADLRRSSEAWANAVPVGPLEGGALAAGMCRSRVARGGLLFVGDAAGAVNPFSGEGIAQAIDGGVAIAEAVTGVSDRRERLGNVYWERLLDRFRHSTRNVDWLPWLVDRGTSFSREFWHAASTESCMMSRAARRMSLDEDPDGARRISSPRVERAWTTLRRRLEPERPLFMHLLDVVRDESASLIDETFARLSLDETDSSAIDVDVALAIVILIVLLAKDPSARRVCDATTTIEEVSSWATDSTALASADLLVAELFDVLAQLPWSWPVSLSMAVSKLLAAETRRTMLEDGERSPREVLADMVSLLGNRVASPASVESPRR
jgi:flavin-dependent dehydrogenase